jgi:hypothetical protein
MKVSAIPSVPDIRTSRFQRLGAQGGTRRSPLGERLSVSAERARWLAELAVAIERAQALARQLGAGEGANPEARALYARLGGALDEVESLRRGSWVGKEPELDPFWRQLFPCVSGAIRD